jgi:hypothetical protein
VREKTDRVMSDKLGILTHIHEVGDAVRRQKV